MGEPLHVCVVTEYFYPEMSGGSPTMLSQLMRSLKDAYSDIEIDVITSRNLYRSQGLKLLPREDWNGIRVLRLLTPKSNRPSTVMRLIAGALFSVAALIALLCSRKKYDLVCIGTNPPPAPFVAFVCHWLRKTPYIYLIHDLYPDLPIRQGIFTEHHILAKIGRTLQRQWLHHATRVIVQGRCNRKYLLHAYAMPFENITVIPHWADQEKIVPLPKASRFREKHTLTGCIVLYAGNLGPFQGLHNVLDGAAILSQSCPGVTIVMVGSGIQAKELADRIARDKLTNVRIFPPVASEDYPDLLASADIALVTLATGVDGLALPSKFYCSLASGRPVVAVVAAASELTYVLDEEQCGCRVEQSNPRRLAECIQKLASSPELLEQYGTNARKAMLAKYTLPHIAERYYQLFQEVMMECPGRKT